MATILKVHGTFASGPEEGDKWWQRGSECCSHVGELVEAEDGHLKIEQVVWDGLNSERSRQAAAAKLLDRMGELEKAGEPYCVVGHSHGGSVISAALLRATYYKRPLEKLSRWITIGTPFIEAKRSRLLFSRLGPAGKTAFLSVWAMIAAIMGLAVLGELNPTESPRDSVWVKMLTAFVLLVSMTIVFYPMLWLLARNRLHWHNKKAQDQAKTAFAGKWLSLRHEDDEAVQGLGAFESFKHPIFPRNFAVSVLSRASMIIVPLMVGVAMYAISKTDNTSNSKPAATASSKSESAQATASTPASTSPKSEAANSSASESNDSPLPTWATVVGIVVVVLIGGGIVIGIPVAVYYLVHLSAPPTSRALSYGLNRMAWSQLRATSLGSDIDGESGRYARANPIWLDAKCPPLPRPLATEISTVSDTAAANSIAKFRAALSELSFYRLDDGGRDALNAFLTGDELIHTTYFKIPRFRKLLAYSIAQSPGFRPSAALRNDPDFPLIEQWYRELTAPPQEAAVPSVAAPALPA